MVVCHGAAIAFAIIILLSAHSVFATERYISLGGSDLSGDGTTFRPYRTIGHAVSEANIGDTLTVMPGDYDDGFTYLYNQVYLRGQYGSDSTTIICDSAGSGLFLDDYSGNVVIDGLSFEGGSNHGIIILYAGNFTIKNSVFRNCYSDSAGGAIYLSSAFGSIHDNLFESNSAYFSGGAIFTSYSSGLIYDNIFEDNFIINVEGNGGALTCQYYNVSAGTGFVIQNNVFRLNSANYGGAVYVGYFSNLSLLNNLFHNNSATGAGGGIAVNYDAYPDVYNNIFMYNNPDGMQVGNYSLTSCGFNDYFGNSPTNGCIGCNCSDSNFYLNPMFANFAGLDYHLTDNSGLINEGYSSGLKQLIDYDYEGQKRVLSTEIDIGPDEYADCSIGGDFMTTGPTEDCPGLLVNFSAINLVGYWDSLTWNFGDGYFAYNTIDPEHQYMDTGSFTVSLTISTPCTSVVVSRQDLVRAMDKPLLNFSASQTSGCAPLTVNFQNLTPNPVSEYAWLFGDGHSSSAVNPTNVYMNPGSYTVRLYAINACGEDSLIRTGYIEVIPGATADFAAQPLAGSAPLWVYFTDSSEANPIEWHWTFGDNSGGDIEQHPDHRYLYPGIFDVRLICANECGTPDTLVREEYVTVYGFETMLYNTVVSDRYHFEYDITVDSLYGLFDRTIGLRASLFNNPTRGDVELSFGDSTLNLFDSTYLQAVLSKDVPRGEYEIVLTASGSGGFPIDTLSLYFTSTSDPIIGIIPDTLDFGQVPEDSAKNINMRVENISFFGDNFLLLVSNVSASGEGFSVQNPGQFQLDAIGYRDIPVTFAPGGLGTFQGQVTVVSDDPAFPQLTIPLYGEGVVERTPPAIDSTSPAAFEEEFDVTGQVRMYLSEPIDTVGGLIDMVSVLSGKSGLTIEGELNYNGEENILIFSPLGGFLIQDSIIITINGDIVDYVGNSLDGDGDGVGVGSPVDDYIFWFTTGLAVYPGDANNDGIVNEMDVLPLGVYWDLSGDSRGLPPLWHRQASKSWTPLGATYADCNGDGLVDESDLLVIGTNWGLTHQIEGLPSVFTVDDLIAAASSFGAIQGYLNGANLGEKGVKIKDILANYLSAPENPERFSLGRNFPNPFNPITKIDFSIPVSCHVQLEVYNVLGQRVKLLVDENCPSGLNTVTWDGTDSDGNPVPSGVYFYRMTAEEFNEVRKMLLIR
jgi:predicted outer membrane repeat protein